MTKDKLDRQLTGQASTPFMKVTINDNHSIQNNPKRGVTFNAIEINKIIHPEIDPLVKEEIKVEIKGIIIIEIIMGPITEIDQEADGTIIGQVI